MFLILTFISIISILSDAISAVPLGHSIKVAPRVTYFGGPVISNIQVFTIYWGSSFTKPQADKVENYYKQVVNSSYLDWLVEYNTPSQRIGRGSFIGSYFAKDAPTGNIKQDQVEAFLLSLRSKDLIPKTTADTYYAIHTDRSVSFTTTDGSSCSEFLAAHYSFKDEQGKYVYWAVMPDCGSRYDTGAISHELIETITNPTALVKTTVGETAWFDDPEYQEIGDLCNSRSGQTTGSDGKIYSVQRIWSEKRQACVDK